jgi:uncharacterized membrane protein YeiB
MWAAIDFAILLALTTQSAALLIWGTTIGLIAVFLAAVSRVEKHFQFDLNWTQTTARGQSEKAKPTTQRQRHNANFYHG